MTKPTRNFGTELRIRIDKEVHAKAKVVCADAGMNISFVVRAFIEHLNKADGTVFPLTFGNRGENVE